ncbi:MAG: RNA 2',3'-cyclic phosphodiesterase [Spirochaetales bacterium]|nr:RNA 2',3'-cyclic phosphodiesterase [Spirochaetales bacterium]
MGHLYTPQKNSLASVFAEVHHECVRTFLAIFPPKRFAQEISERLFCDEYAQLRWMKTENLHITLCFLGKTEPRVITHMQNHLPGVFESFHSFSVQLGPIHNLGSKNQPHSLVLDVREGGEQLAALNSSIRNSLTPWMSLEDYPYCPHMTIGRWRRGKNRRESGASTLLPDDKTANLGVFRVREVVLLESILESSGARYRPLQSWPLKEFKDD